MSKGSNYYGGFFWVALVSFIVPLFVGWKAFENLKPTTKPTPQVDVSGVDHGVWDYLLKSYVSRGLVDYNGMKKDYLFREYLRELGACNPDALESEDEKLALLCNASALTILNTRLFGQFSRNREFTLRWFVQREAVLQFAPKRTSGHVSEISCKIRVFSSPTTPPT